jgi:tetratricopeptide (TPR) repeat protein
MREVWHASDPKGVERDAAPDGPSVRNSLGAPAPVQWWWGLYLLSCFLGNLTYRLSVSSNPTLGDLQVVTWVSVVSDLVDVPSAFAAVLLIGRITTWQTLRRDRINSRDKAAGSETTRSAERWKGKAYEELRDGECDYNEGGRAREDHEPQITHPAAECRSRDVDAVSELSEPRFRSNNDDFDAPVRFQGIWLSKRSLVLGACASAFLFGIAFIWTGMRARDTGHVSPTQKEPSRNAQAILDRTILAADAPEKRPVDPSHRARELLVNGLASLKQENFDKAIQDFDEAIQLDPSIPGVFISRGHAHRGKWALEQAIADYDVAIRFDPKDREAYRSRGKSWLDKGDKLKAIRDFNDAIRLDPDDSEVYRWRGQAYLFANDFDKALQDLDMAVRLDPQQSEAYRLRGEICLTRGRMESSASLQGRNLEEAIRELNVAISLNPKDGEAYRDRGEARAEKGEYERAIDDFNEALHLHPNDPFAYRERGLAWRHKRRYREAISDLSRAIELAPNHMKTLASLDLARLLATCPDPEFRDGKRAIQIATHLCEPSDWTNGYFLDALAAGYAEVGQFDLAVRYENMALKVENPSPMESIFRKHLRLYEQKRPLRGYP